MHVEFAEESGILVLELVPESGEDGVLLRTIVAPLPADQQRRAISRNCRVVRNDALPLGEGAFRILFDAGADGSDGSGDEGPRGGPPLAAATGSSGGGAQAGAEEATGIERDERRLRSPIPASDASRVVRDRLARLHREVPSQVQYDRYVLYHAGIERILASSAGAARAGDATGAAGVAGAGRGAAPDVRLDPMLCDLMILDPGEDDAEALRGQLRAALAEVDRLSARLGREVEVFDQVRRELRVVTEARDAEARFAERTEKLYDLVLGWGVALEAEAARRGTSPEVYACEARYSTDHALWLAVEEHRRRYPASAGPGSVRELASAPGQAQPSGAAAGILAEELGDQIADVLLGFAGFPDGRILDGFLTERVARLEALAYRDAVRAALACLPERRLLSAGTMRILVDLLALRGVRDPEFAGAVDALLRAVESRAAESGVADPGTAERMLVVDGRDATGDARPGGSR